MQDEGDVGVTARLAAMEDALMRMPRIEREIFLAVRLDDLSYAEIAARTGLSVAGAERVFVRALRHFIRNLRDPRRGRWRRWLS